MLATISAVPSAVDPVGVDICWFMPKRASKAKRWLPEFTFGKTVWCCACTSAASTGTGLSWKGRLISYRNLSLDQLAIATIVITKRMDCVNSARPIACTTYSSKNAMDSHLSFRIQTAPDWNITWGCFANFIHPGYSPIKNLDSLFYSINHSKVSFLFLQLWLEPFGINSIIEQPLTWMRPPFL